MKNFKKNPLFFTILSILLLVFVVALAWNVSLYLSLSTAESNFSKAQMQYKRTQSQDPSDKSVTASEANIEDIKAKLDNLLKELSPGSSDIITEAPMKEGYLFLENLRGQINTWRREAEAKEIYLRPDECFGYGSYYKNDSTPPPNEAVDELWKQSSVLSYILSKLYAAKVEGVAMQIDLVQREVLPEEASKTAVKETKSTSRFATRRPSSMRQVNTNTDTFAIDKILSAKVDGSIDTFAFKISFRAKTDVLRNFLNSLKDFDLMLVVRSVEVSVGTPIVAPIVLDASDNIVEVKKELTPEDIALRELNAANEPVVKDSISQFTVTIEYVELSKEPVAENKTEE